MICICFVFWSSSQSATAEGFIFYNQIPINKVKNKLRQLRTRCVTRETLTLITLFEFILANSNSLFFFLLFDQFINSNNIIRILIILVTNWWVTDVTYFLIFLLLVFDSIFNLFQLKFREGILIRICLEFSPP